MNREELRDKLIEEAWEGLKNSYSPYSKFPVGAAVMGADGTVYRYTCQVGGKICHLTYEEKDRRSETAIRS